MLLIQNTNLDTNRCFFYWWEFRITNYRFIVNKLWIGRIFVYWKWLRIILMMPQMLPVGVLYLICFLIFLIHRNFVSIHSHSFMSKTYLLICTQALTLREAYVIVMIQLCNLYPRKHNFPLKSLLNIHTRLVCGLGNNMLELCI